MVSQSLALNIRSKTALCREEEFAEEYECYSCIFCYNTDPTLWPQLVWLLLFYPSFQQGSLKFVVTHYVFGHLIGISNSWSSHGTVQMSRFPWNELCWFWCGFNIFISSWKDFTFFRSDRGWNSLLSENQSSNPSPFIDEIVHVFCFLQPNDQRIFIDFEISDFFCLENFVKFICVLLELANQRW